MLRALRRLLRSGGRIAYTTIFVAPDLSPAERRRAQRSGPRAVASRSDQQQLLTSAGFVDVQMINLTAEFAATARAWLEGWEANAEELSALDLPGAFEERQRERQVQLRAIDDGLLRRGLWTTRSPTLSRCSTSRGPSRGRPGRSRPRPGSSASAAGSGATTSRRPAVADDGDDDARLVSGPAPGARVPRFPAVRAGPPQQLAAAPVRPRRLSVAAPTGGRPRPAFGGQSGVILWGACSGTPLQEGRESSVDVLGLGRDATSNPETPAFLRR